MDKTKLEQIYKTIEEYNKIIISAHKRPDGDAVASSFGLKDIIKSTWPSKEVHVTGESTEFTSFIGVPEELSDDEFEGALYIGVDTGNKSRLGDQRYHLADKIIKIDHHVKVEDFGDIDYVDTTRPACALIILDLFILHQEKLKMTSEGAKALYFGILTDTGRFKYDGVDGDTFRSVALLFDIGLDKKEIHRHLDTRTEELTRFKGYLLQHYKKTKNGVVYFKIKPRLLRKFKVGLEEATSLVNELGVFDEYPIWLLFAEYEEGIVRCRMRSKGPAINELAAKYDGGGHKLASGATLGTWDKTKDLIKDADALAKDYKLKRV
jgi:phosphoesterase RecJ-like protein